MAGFEVNHTWWRNGEREGQTQVFFDSQPHHRAYPVHEGIGITAAFGYQVA